jgi:hypothetical protein
MLNYLRPWWPLRHTILKHLLKFKLKQMKTLLIAIAMVATMSFTTKSAQAQITTDDVLNAAAGLVNVQVGNVNVNLVDVVDVSNVLNNNTVTIVALNDILNNLTIDNVLNNLLRDANIITGNQVVVGAVVNALGQVTQVLVADKDILKMKKAKK